MSYTACTSAVNYMCMLEALLQHCLGDMHELAPACADASDVHEGRHSPTFSVQELEARSISQAFAMASGLTQEDFGWGSPTFHKMVSPRRLSLVLKMLKQVLSLSLFMGSSQRRNSHHAQSPILTAAHR